MAGEEAQAISDDAWRATLVEVQAQVFERQRQERREAAPSGWVAVEPAQGRGWPGEWPQQQWHTAFQILFCQVPASIVALRPRQDDLLMFAYFADVAKLKATPVFARRRGHALPEDLRWAPGAGARCAEVDWSASLLLNVVLQTGFRLTMACCAEQDLQGATATVTVSGGGAAAGRPTSAGRDSTGIDAIDASPTKAVKVVHASPSRVPVNLDQSKASFAEPAPAYPDICFAVDDFGESCNALVMESASQCFCVTLHADVESSWRRAAAAAGLGAEAAAAEPARCGLGAAPPERQPGGTMLFSGFVSHKQLLGALGDRLHSPLRALRGGEPSTTHVRMTGPGGVGAADVAVTALVEWGRSSPEEDTRPLLSPPASPLPKLLAKASRVARDVLGAARAAADQCASGRARLRCAVMTLALPAEYLAESILSQI